MSEQVIIAMSGRKGAGKNEIAKFIPQYWFARSIYKGNIPDLKEVVSLNNLPNFNKQLMYEEIFECSFADNIKEFCIETLGLSREHCYGTDDEKNSLTEYDWESAPNFLRWKFAESNGHLNDMPNDAAAHYYSSGSFELPMKSGKMSGREIMQIFGTELIRHTFGNVWAAATIRSIRRIKKPVSVITDNRFPNEIEEVLRQPRAYIIRLTRSPFGTVDQHASENSLDDYSWDHPRCFVIDNADMTIEEQNEAMIPILNEIFSLKE